MPKVITSPVKRWPGTVTLSDPLSYPQVFAWRDAVQASAELPEGSDIFSRNAAMVPGVLACVEAWNLEGISTPTEDNFPATPPISAAKLLAWIAGEISGLFAEAEEVPLE